VTASRDRTAADAGLVAIGPSGRPGARSFVPVSAAIAGKLHDIFDAHATGKERDGKEETNDEYRQHHENPCDGFETAVAETLEHTGAEDADDEPPKNRVETAGQ
jgi:hypothetical protein